VIIRIIYTSYIVQNVTMLLYILTLRLGADGAHCYTADLTAEVKAEVPRQMWLKSWLKLHIVYFRKIGNRHQGYAHPHKMKHTGQQGGVPDSQRVKKRDVPKDASMSGV
jgi:hypothetical protein